MPKKGDREVEYILYKAAVAGVDGEAGSQLQDPLSIPFNRSK